MIEIRRDTYLNEPAGPRTGGFTGLVEALTALMRRTYEEFDRERIRVTRT